MEAPPARSPMRDRLIASETIRTAAAWVVLVSASWWLLQELASVLRPLLLAVFLAYALMPYFVRLRRTVHSAVALTLLASLTTLVLLGIALTVYLSLLGLKDDLPELKENSQKAAATISEFLNNGVLKFLPVNQTDGQSLGEQVSAGLTAGILKVVNAAAGGLVEAAAAGLYLLFIMLESARFPQRVRLAYPEARAEQILDIAGRINAAIISFIRAKVISGLLLAGMAWIVLAVAGVKFSFLWALLTFLCNFIPYLGSVVGYSLPTAFTLLQFQFGWPFAITAAVLLAAHVVCATTLEPMVIGRAVGLSPLIVLASLSVWGLLWGLPGMFLAIPLTVVVKIVLDHVSATRPISRLISQD